METEKEITKSAYEKLSNKQRAFVDAYLSNGFNATQAATTAKYADANSQSGRLLVNVGIAAAIKEKMDVLAMSAEEALARLTAIARGNISDIFSTVDMDAAGTRIDKEEAEDLPPSSRRRLALLDIEKAIESGKSLLIKSYSVSLHGQRIEMYSAQDALNTILKIHGKFVEKHEHSGKDGEPIKMELIDPKAALAKRLTEMRDRQSAPTG